jgi:hypothetical protein
MRVYRLAHAVHFCTILALAACKTTVAAADAASWRAPSSALNDCRLSLQAREALAGDVILRSANIGVSVHDYFAVIWGSVEDRSMAQRAECIVRSVPGIAGIDNQLRLEATSTVAGRTKEAGQESQRAARNKAGLAPNLRGIGSRDNVVPVLRAAQSTPPGLKAGIPIRLTTGPESALPTVVLLKPLEGSTESVLWDRIERIRREDRRFQGMQFRLAGPIVYVWSGQRGRAEIFEFAKNISRVRGIQKVLIEPSMPAGTLFIP